jgi:phage regulator Rha-like protein
MKQVTRTRGISHEAPGEEKVISSIEIAALLGKPHNDVLKAIRKMEPAWQEVHQGKFSQMQIQEKLSNGGYRMRPCFVLTKTESLFVATKFNDVARAKLVLRWEELELSARKRTVNIAHRALLETEAEVIMRSDEIMKRELSQLNIDAVGCYTMKSVAASLRMTYRDLCQMLVAHDVMNDVDGTYELLPPYTYMGYESYRLHERYSLMGDRRQRRYMVWTEAGRSFVIDLVRRIKKSSN